GAKTINEAILHSMDEFEALGYQVLWQTGKYYHGEMISSLERSGLKHIHALQFIKDMDLAYSASDLVVSRAGALSVSELSLVGKPVIFIPSPNVAEDHQSKNASAFVKHEAAVLLKDSEAVNSLLPIVEGLMNDPAARNLLGENILKMAKPEAAKEIINELEELVAMV